MNMYDIITKKKRGGELSDEEIAYVVTGFTEGSIPDYQMSALLMAICLKGMSIRETATLTLCMRDSGSVADLSSIPGLKADKHSTGGVGDKVSLIVGPMVAALGVPVAKMSGRGLGHTGGTIDKLESIPGFQTSLSKTQFMENVRRMGLAIVGQNEDLAPADKKMYALRDVTATVDSIPLIAASIMSKKLASGSDVIVLDVTTGSGAFMKTLDDAKLLAETMVQIGAHAGKKVYAVITDMNQVLGNCVGNAIEVTEAVEALKGNAEEDLSEACLTIAGLMLIGCNKAKDLKEAKELLTGVIKSGAAFSKFREWIEAQGGDVRAVDNTELLPQPKLSLTLTAMENGYIKTIDAERIGRVSVLLGAGREKKDAKISMSAGIRNYAKVGMQVKTGDTLAELYADEEYRLMAAARYYHQAYTISPEPVKPLTTIYGYVDESGFHTF